MFNIIETFYDDMALARYIVAEAIKEYSLSSSTVTQYKDEKLSQKYGVDVYKLNGVVSNAMFALSMDGL